MHGVVDGRSYAKVRNRLYRPYRAATVWSNSPQYYTYNYGDDDLFLVDGDEATFVSDELPISDLIGITNHKEEYLGTHIRRTDPPSVIPWSGDADFGRYGDILSSIRTRSDELGAEKREHSIDHTALVGDIGDKNFISLSAATDTVAGRYGFSTPKDRLAYVYDAVQATGVTAMGQLSYGMGFDPTVVEPYSHVSLDAYAYATQACEYYKSIGSFSKGNYNAWANTYSNFENRSYRLHNFRHLEISYDVQMIWAYNGNGMAFHAEFHVVNLVECWWGPAYGYNLAFNLNRIQPSTFQFRDLSTVTCTGSIPAGPAWVPVETYLPQMSYDNRPLFETLPYQVDEAFLGNLERFLSQDTRDPRKFVKIVHEEVLNQMPNIRPSSFLAASKALDDNLLILKTNELQNLQHLPDILGFLPDLEAIVVACIKAAEGDPSAIINLIDIITGEILKWRFQRDPASRSVDEISNTDIDKALQGIHQRKAATIHGSFRYVFPDAENFFEDGILTLETHAKIRVKFDISTVMMQLLDANSLGLLPNLARIWNLVPFTFVIDWFTNMSKRLHLVDNQSLYTILGISWCLWSYKVVYYPSPSQLALFNLASHDVSRPFGVSVYRREFSRLMPRLKESKFDFLRPTSSPDPVTVGALLCQLALSS